jgi:uncharacterized Zn-binding protein involved in type VI secretion
MPAVARGNGADAVFSLTGLGKLCAGPMMTVTGPSISKLVVGGIPVALQGDLVGPHPFAGCGPDVSVLTLASTKLKVDGRGVGMIGSLYTSDNIIVSAYPKLFVSI